MNLDDLFAWPEMLPTLLLVPVVWLLLRRVDRVRAERLAQLVGPRAQNLTREFSPRRRRVRRWLVTSGFGLALISMIQPQWSTEERQVQQRGIDLIVCLDVSRSMLARDLRPTRLARAQREIRALTGRARGDRMALVAFAGEARLTVPLTQDLATFADLVDGTDPLSVGRGGTDLGAALETALAALQGRSGASQAVLLITDGEDLEQRGLAVARTLADRGITVHCVGIGSAVGSKIVVDEGPGETFLRDRSGREVVSVMDMTGLIGIAEATGGGFINARSAPQPLLELYQDHIRPMAEITVGDGEQSQRKNRFQWPLLAAFLLWMMELCTTDRRASRRSREWKAR